MLIKFVNIYLNFSENHIFKKLVYIFIVIERVQILLTTQIIVWILKFNILAELLTNFAKLMERKACKVLTIRNKLGVVTGTESQRSGGT